MVARKSLRSEANSSASIVAGEVSRRRLCRFLAFIFPRHLPAFGLSVDQKKRCHRIVTLNALPVWGIVPHRLNVETVAPAPSRFNEKDLARRRRLTPDQAIKAFFGSNALVAIVVLTLITVFLFREGSGFFAQNLANIRFYRPAGLEYVDIIRAEAQRHAALSRQLSDIRLVEVRANADQSALEKFDQFATGFSDAGDELNSLVSDATDQALALREALLRSGGQSVDTSRDDQSSDEPVAPAPAAKPADQLAALRSTEKTFEQIIISMKAKIDDLLASPPPFTSDKARESFEKWKTNTGAYLAQLRAASQRLRAWNPDEPVPAYRAVTSFLFGTEWITASFWQDWYGIIPLLVGSILVSVVALVIAVPLGVAGAIYVSEVAAPAERSLIKPYIEFISAIPSVVLGFFGIAV